MRKFGDPVLRTRARPVDRIDDALREQIRRMGELMIDALGVGLAATQVGVLNRVLVYRVHQQSPFAALINPEIEWVGRRGGDHGGGVPEPSRWSTSTSSDPFTSVSARSTRTVSRSRSRRRGWKRA